MQKLTVFLNERKSRYQKKICRAEKQKKQAQEVLNDEPDRQDVKEDLQKVINMQCKYNALIKLIDEIQETFLEEDYRKDRLTTNKKVNEMGMFELAHNSCYIKDGKARYRDYDIDTDARELAIKLLDKYADIPNEFTDDDDFDEFIIECLQYRTDRIEGLIALFYRNLWAMADLYEKLKKYEDLDRGLHF